MATSTHSITITGKVQDIGFRNTIEHIGRLFGLPGMVFNANAGIKEQKLSVYVELPDDFTKLSSDDDIDIGRKLDKATERLYPLRTHILL